MASAMLSRVLFIAVALFWLTMNVLLWQTESGSRRAEESEVPAQLVWQKILTSPDSSSLQLLHHGKNIGFCHWITSVGEEWATVTEENMPPGLPRKSRRYNIRVEGSVLVTQISNRVRFEASLKVGPDHEWQELNLRCSIRPVTWLLHAVADHQTLELKVQEGKSRWNRVFAFSDLEHPSGLAAEFGGPYVEELLRNIALPASPVDVASVGLGIRWEAREDNFWIGHALVRAYRLQAQLLDHYRIAFIVSRVGEILRVELPDDLVLVNDQLSVL